MPNLDINTPLGQRSLADEREAIAIFHRHHPGCYFVETPKDQPAAIDGMIERDGVTRAIVEVKARSFTLEQFQITHGSQWLITASKIDKAAEIADALCVPLWGFLYLVNSKVLLTQQLHHRGRQITSISRRHSVTQATINGGSANRLNAYVDMREARILR